ncbi:MAG: hypothetical protein LAO78_06235 [Acidobacteriia bacterium]|nr:hypothetical protein [Terriglobia bacterium]
MISSGSAKYLFLFAAILFSRAASAQGMPWLDDLPSQDGQQQAVSQEKPGAQPLEVMVPQVATTTVPSTVTIPAGTRVLMVLKSPLHTTSGTVGSGLYLETLYPVVQGDGVVIPAHTQVQGVVEANERPGHVKRASEFRFRFTTMIFPNNFVVPINGGLQSIPGARNIRTHNQDGTLKPVDQAEKVITPAAAGAVGGAIIGARRGFGIGLLPGAGLGAALGLGAVLLKRGDEINLARGTNVEMILQTPFSLERAQIAANARYTPQQPRPFVAPPACAASIVPNRNKRQSRACWTPDPARLPLTND